MRVPLDNSVVCPILVGRAADVEALDQLLAQASRAGVGSPRAALLAGEAGIGKSRLAAEARARAADFAILSGSCFEPDRALPYAPLLDVLRAFCAARPSAEAAEALQPHGPELVKVFPELATLLPDLAPTPRLEPEQERRRLFQALAQFVIDAGATSARPFLLIVEDLHWCDDISLEFLLFFARQIAAQPGLILLTYRSDEIHPTLRHFLAGLDREHLSVEFTLNRLPPDGVEAMIRAIFGQARPVQAEFVEALHALTDGNPFFVEETLKALVSAGEIYYAVEGWTRKPLSELHIPRTVQDAVAQRTQHLSPAANRLLTLAAVAGRRFDFALLQALTQSDEAALLALVRELLAAQLVVEESMETLAFRHALTRQAIYAGLLGRERRALHQAIAETLERVHARTLAPHVGDLADHFYEAGVWDRALDYARRAGEQAQALYAPRAALEHYTRAIQAAQQLSMPLPLELYRTRGQMHQTLGEFDSAHADYQAMLDEAQGRGDRPAHWQALMDLGFLWAARDYSRTGAYFQQALELAHDLDDSATLAYSLNRMGNWHANIEQPLEALRCHHEALRIFESLNDKPGLAATLDLLGITSYIAGDMWQGVAYYERAIRLFRELNDRGGLLSSLMMYSTRGADYLGRTTVAVQTSLEARLRDGEEALQIAREIGARPGEALGQTWLGFNLAAVGEYGQALERLHQGLEVAEAIQHRQFMAVTHLILGALYLDILALPEAQTHFEQALSLAHENASGVWVAVATSFLASTYLQQGQTARAEAALQTVFSPDLPMHAIGQRQLWCTRAELALSRQEAPEALTIVQRLIASAPNVQTAGEPAIPRLALLRGEALIAVGKNGQAELVLQEAQAAAHGYGLLPLVWRLHVALGKVCLARGRRDDAAGEFSSARDIMEALAARLPEAALRDSFRRGTIEMMGRATPDSPRRRAKQAAGGLTAREREVATLVAEGRSNREIAAALVVSPRTVEVHIANIMSKLELSSRAQIAVWAAEKGLVRPRRS